MLFRSFLQLGIDKLAQVTEAAMAYRMKVNGALRSLVIDGIFTGVGSVLSFLPDYSHIVLLPVTYGGQRIHSKSCVCDGQASA